LPLVVGPQYYSQTVEPLLSVENIGDYKDVYDPNVSPQIFNVFGSVAPSFTETMVPSTDLKVNVYDKVVETIPIRSSMKPMFDDFVYDGLRRLVLGSLVHASNNPDRHITSALFDFLQEKPSPPSYSSEYNKNYNDDGEFYRLSLPAVEILAGREHGIPPWYKFRQLADPDFPLNPTWDDIDPTMIKDQSKIVFDRSAFNALKRVYKDVVDIDTYTGCLSEVVLENAVVGRTLGLIISQQFVKAIVSDRFFYSNGKDDLFANSKFTSDQLKEIRKSSITRLVCDLMRPKNIQINPFLRKMYEGVNCNDAQIPTFSLNPWKDLNKEKYPEDAPPESYTSEYESNYSNESNDYSRRSYGESNDDYSRRSYGESNDDYSRRSYGESNDDYSRHSYGESNDDYSRRSYGESNDDYSRRSYGESNDDYSRRSYGESNDYSRQYDNRRQNSGYRN
jgi:hypothetical protein